MRLLLVDGHYYLYRSFFAIRGLTNSRGEPTNAIYGFLKALRKMLLDVRPDRAAVIWDAGLPERRTRLQPDYKQNRPSMPDDLRSQEAWLQKNIPLLGTASLSQANTEADDLIASYALQAAAAGADTVIATNDKDILQIVRPGISIYSTSKNDLTDGSFALLGPAEVETKWGVPAHRISDVLALTGDSSDNISGVPGIGSKTAVQIVRSASSLREILDHPEHLDSPKIREKIVVHRETILANLEMVRLDEDLPCPVPWTELAIQPRREELLAALRECEFHSLVREIEAGLPAAPAVQGELFAAG